MIAKCACFSVCLLLLVASIWIASSLASGSTECNATASVGTGAAGNGYWARASVTAGSGLRGHYRIRAWDNQGEDLKDLDYDGGVDASVSVAGSSGTNAEGWISGTGEGTACFDSAEAS